MPPEDAADLWDVVVNRMRAVPFGVELIEVLRVEAGLIVLDYDYEAHQVTPFDLSLDRMVALGTVDFQGAGAPGGGRRPAPADEDPDDRRRRAARVRGEVRAGDTVVGT